MKYLTTFFFNAEIKDLRKLVLTLKILKKKYPLRVFFYVNIHNIFNWYFWISTHNIIHNGFLIVFTVMKLNVRYGIMISLVQFQLFCKIDSTDFSSRN